MLFNDVNGSLMTSPNHTQPPSGIRTNFKVGGGNCAINFLVVPFTFLALYIYSVQLAVLVSASVMVVHFGRFLVCPMVSPCQAIGKSVGGGEGGMWHL